MRTLSPLPLLALAFSLLELCPAPTFAGAPPTHGRSVPGPSYQATALGVVGESFNSGEPLPIRSPLEPSAIPMALAAKSGPSPAADGVGAETAVVDVLVMYTPAARDGAGGVVQIRREILEAFAIANQVFSNSLTQVQLNPVGLIEAVYTESGSFFDDGPAFFGFAGSTRRAYRADLALLVAQHDNVGFGFASGPGQPGPNGNSAAAFIVGRRSDELPLGYFLANRAGFLMGAGLERPGDGSVQGQGAFRYARSHTFDLEGVRFGDVMADLASVRLPYFSNPRLRYQGQPLGIEAGLPGEADNASAIRALGPVVAGYESCTNRVQFESAETRLSESAGTARIAIRRDGPPDSVARVRVIAIAGTARPTVDYSYTVQTVEFGPGEMEKAVEVTLLDDPHARGPRRFRLRLDSPAAGTGAGLHGEITIHVEDDDVAFQFARSSVSIGEGETAVSVPLRRHRPDGPQAVELSLGDPSGRGLRIGDPAGDARPLPQTVTFQPGQLETMVTISAANDPQAGPAERQTVVLRWDGAPENRPAATLEVWVRDASSSSRALGVSPAGGTNQLTGPAMPLPQGGFLACERQSDVGSTLLAAYQPDGSRAPFFQPVVFRDGPDSSSTIQFGKIRQMVRQPDGRILVAGAFGSVNGQPRAGLVRLAADGTLDPQFNPRFQGAVWSVCLQPDGRILAVGEFSEVNGVRRYSAARLEADGTLDPTFAPVFTSDYGVWLMAVAMQGDRILIGGQFEQLAGAGVSHLVRLRLDGTRDTRFAPNLNGIVTGIRMLPNGQFYAFGYFRTPRPWAIRFNANGSADATHRFTGLNGRVHDLVPLADGRALVAGQFGSPTNSTVLLARFDPQGAPDPEFSHGLAPGGRADAILPQARGDAIVLGQMSFSGSDNLWNQLLVTGQSWSPQLSIRREAAGVGLDAQTVDGLPHRLERSTNLVAWQTLGERVATGTVETFVDPAPEAVSFYRMQVVSDAPSEP